MTPRDDERRRTRWMMSLRGLGGVAMPIAIAAPLLAGALLLAQACLLADVLHGVIADARTMEQVTPVILALAAILIVRAALAYAGERAASAAAERIKMRLRENLFAQMLRARPEQLAGRQTGALATALVDQVDALDGFFARFLPATIQAAILPLAFAVVVVPIDWVAGALFLVTAPLIPVFMALVGWGAEAANRAQADAFTRLSARFADRLRGVVTLKLFGRSRTEVEETRIAGEELRARTLDVLRIAFLSSAVLEFFAALGVAGVALYIGLTYLGWVDLRGSPLTLQAGLFILLMAPEIYQPLRLLSAHYHDRARAKAAVAEIEKAFGALPDPPVDAPDRPAARPVRSPAAPLILRRVTVLTPDRKRRLAGPLDLEIAPGTHVALLGESGIGKTSLLEAIAGLRACDGAVCLGEEPITQMPEQLLRDRIALIGQRPRIFAGTIADNIRLGRTACSDIDLHAAAARACVSAFADALPHGLDTPLGEEGIGLSGGEAHRVALARLYLRQPDLILLDEPTAHLDVVTESRVLDGLIDFARDRTMIAVTHSPALAARMPLVFHLVGGALLPSSDRAHIGAPALEVVA
jgi:ATP-binding cassette, subfamily C, bacterial CydD